MKFMITLLAVVGVLLATFGPQASASAGVDLRKIMRADAFFHTMDASGCINTLVSSGISRLGKGTEYSYGIWIYQEDVCWGRVLIDAHGGKTLTNSEVQFTGNMDSATLTTTVHLTEYDNENQGFDVSVNMMWIGTGEISEFHEHQNYWLSPSCHVKYHLKWAVRSASASGTISDGITSFTPEPSTSSYLRSWKGVNMSEGCE